MGTEAELPALLLLYPRKSAFFALHPRKSALKNALRPIAIPLQQRDATPGIIAGICVQNADECDAAQDHPRRHGRVLRVGRAARRSVAARPAGRRRLARRAL